MNEGHGRFNVTGGYHVLIDAPRKCGVRGFELSAQRGYTMIHAQSMLDGKTRKMLLPCTVQQLYMWARGSNIQEVMPKMTPAQREFIMTGLMDEEFNDLCKEIDDEPELRKCQQCGEMRECTFSHCPYDEELWPERVKEGDEQWRCEKCIQDLCDAI